MSMGKRRPRGRAPGRDGAPHVLAGKTADELRGDLRRMRARRPPDAKAARPGPSMLP